MARFNEILVGRYNRFLQKFLSIKGGPPSPQLASEIMAGWAMFHGAENRYLEGWDEFAASFSLATGGVGNVDSLRVRNPVGSNVIAVFFKASAATSTPPDTAILESGPSLADLIPNALANNRFDARSRPQTSMNISTTGAPATALGSIKALATMGANFTYDFIVHENQEIPILPGDAIQLRQGTTNQPIIFTLQWRERFLEDSERT